MSKFFQGANDISSSESESSSDNEEQQTSKNVQQTGAVKKQQQKQKRVGNYVGDSSESDDDERVVKSGKSKRMEALGDLLKTMRNHININDFSSLQTDFDKLQSDVAKEIEDQKTYDLPPTILRALMDLEDCINDVTKEQKKKFNKTNSESYNKLKQRLKKYLTETGTDEDQYQKQLERFRENPVDDKDDSEEEASEDESDDESGSEGSSGSGSDESGSDSESDSDSNSDSEGEEKVKAKKVEPKKKEVGKSTQKMLKAVKKDSDDESGSSSSSDDESGSSSSKSESDSEQQDSESDSSEDDEVDNKASQNKNDPYSWYHLPREEQTPEQRRWKWVLIDLVPEGLREKMLKKKGKKEKKDDDKDKDDNQEKKDNKVKKQNKEDETQIMHKQQLELDYTLAVNVNNTLRLFIEERQRGKYDIQYHIEVMQKAYSQQQEKSLKIKILMSLVDTMFQSSKREKNGFFSRKSWIQTTDYLVQLLEFLKEPEYKENLSKSLNNNKENSKKGNSSDEAKEGAVQEDNEQSVLPSLVNFIEKLDAQLLKAYQNVNHTSLEYFQRVNDENKILLLCADIEKYLDDLNEFDKSARMGIIILDHTYYKQDNFYAKLNEKIEGKANKDELRKQIFFVKDSDSKAFIQNLIHKINLHGNIRMKIKATLQQIYHHALHDRYYEAKRLLLTTHVADLIQKQSSKNQVMYNRAVTQLGMAAFRLGLFSKAHEILQEVCQYQKIKEILAQGISRQQDKTIEIEIEEIKRMVPFHQHLNVHLIDCMYLISAMILEIPNLAEQQYSVSKEIICKNFKKLVEQYDHKAFHLAIEAYKDNVVYAARALNASNWREATKHIFSIPLLSKLQEFERGSLKAILEQKLKEVALVTYVCRGSNSYRVFGLESLQEMFELDQKHVQKNLSQLIIKGSLDGQIDMQSKSVIITQQNTETEELQQMSLQYVDKVDMMVEQNERIIDIMTEGKTYGHRERTQAQLFQINSQKRNRQQQNQQTGIGQTATSQSQQSQQAAQSSVGQKS